MIDLSPRNLEIVQRVLRDHVPGCAVRAFGSRAKWTAKDYSDLDLAVVGDSELGRGTLARLRDAFEDSRLPMRVDVLDWHDISPEFRKLIERDYVDVLDTPPLSSWRPTTLGQCASLVRDSVTPASCGDVPYVGLEHIGQGTLSLLGRGSAQDVGSAKTAFRAGDILFGKLRPYFRKVVRPRFDGICSTDIWVVRPQAGVDAGFLFYLLASSRFVDAASQGAEGTRMPRAKWGHVSGFTFRLPPFAEQGAIARILGALDGKIELNRRIAATLEGSLKAMFQSWFGPSENPVPEGWGVKSLDEVAHFQNGLALQKHRPPDGEGRLPVLKIAQLRSEVLDGNEYASSNIPASCKVADGDLIFSWSGSLMAKIWCGGRAALNQHLFKVTSVGFRSWLIFGWLQQHMRTFQAIAEDKATTMGHIRRQHLREAKCVVPGDEALAKADGICAPLHEQLIRVKVESRNLAHLRDTLLPKLISGEIRIRDAEKIAEDAT